MLDPRQALQDYMSGMKTVSKMNPNELSAFGNFSNEVFKDSKIDLKTKELISIALSVHLRCEYCIVGHAYNALKAGLTKEEIMDAAMVAIAFGGGPTLAYTVTLLERSLAEFENDFK